MKTPKPELVTDLLGILKTAQTKVLILDEEEIKLLVAAIGAQKCRMRSKREEDRFDGKFHSPAHERWIESGEPKSGSVYEELRRCQTVSERFSERTKLFAIEEARFRELLFKRLLPRVQPVVLPSLENVETPWDDRPCSKKSEPHYGKENNQ